MEKIRIQKYISECGVMSRRSAERQIELGNVTVNGEPADIGMKIAPGEDEVCINGKPVVSEQKRSVCIMLNKPRGYVTTMRDDHGRPCVRELVEDVGCRVYPAGRLDLESEGLLLMTNDGELANRLMHPRHHIPKVYHVKIVGEVTPEQLKKLNSPMIIDDYKTKPANAVVVTGKKDHTVLAITLHEGRNRQIRKMCASLGLNIVSLKRIAVGNIKLGNLKPGTWKKLTPSQIDYLRNAGEGKK